MTFEQLVEYVEQIEEYKRLNMALRGCQYEYNDGEWEKLDKDFAKAREELEKIGITFEGEI